MSKKKEKLLQKYIEKKKKQLKRDELMAQIAQIDKENMNRAKKDNFNEKRVKKREVYEKSLDDLIYLESKKNESCSGDKSGDRNESDYNDGECKDHNSEDKSSHEECEDYKVEEYDNHNSEEDDDKSCNEDTDFNNTLILSNNEVILEDPEHSNTKDYLIVTKNQSSTYNLITVDRPILIQNQRQQLPIFFEQEEITSLIRNNPIVLIKGPTGCGKTTQIPQFIYESNLNQGGLIAITQPRRISTISVSSRINEELNQDLCGYQIRYDNNFKKYHKMVAMTDGILIKEIQEDFLLLKYSVIILDEVHERSCNLDI
ncbi:ATP-dependent RNA helicase DHX37 [Nosema bombycis CQ1]|uniref:ATP-dependent RNA helicase DHX37 n=1 Tax=Nosema bombycis (strain CQ1 / CVCC 102059) TaxID=578461 RepID=R0KT75_NOSB1|nr:ATP-dependent RNA helicase DHX37 [Nosema bombycis CQ1]|eukprot:EOB14001.1 ATP-dependent RNA helicase DHX37 [Nosema bombycis CQ1]